MASYSYKISVVFPLFIKNTTLRMKMRRHLPRDTQRLLRLVPGHQILHFASFLSILAFTSVFWIKFYFPLIHTIWLELRLLRIKHPWESTYNPVIHCPMYDIASYRHTVRMYAASYVSIRYIGIWYYIQHPRVHKYSIIHTVIHYALQYYICLANIVSI